MTGGTDSQSSSIPHRRETSSQEQTSSKGQCTDEGLGLGKTRSERELVTRGNWRRSLTTGARVTPKDTEFSDHRDLASTSNKMSGRSLHQPVSIVMGTLPKRAPSCDGGDKSQILSTSDRWWSRNFKRPMSELKLQLEKKTERYLPGNSNVFCVQGY